MIENRSPEFGSTQAGIARVCDTIDSPARGMLQDILNSMNAVSCVNQVGGADGVSCPICFKIFKTMKSMLKHKAIHNISIKCANCGKTFSSRLAFNEHKAYCRNFDLPVKAVETDFFTVTSKKGFGSVHLTYVFVPIRNVDMLQLNFDEFFDAAAPLVDSYITQGFHIKFGIELMADFHKGIDPDYKGSHFFTRPTALEFTLSFEDGEKRLRSDIDYIMQRVEEFNKLASNWILDAVTSIRIHFHSVLAYGGSGSAGHC